MEHCVLAAVGLRGIGMAGQSHCTCGGVPGLASVSLSMSLAEQQQQQELQAWFLDGSKLNKWRNFCFVIRRLGNSSNRRWSGAECQLLGSGLWSLAAQRKFYAALITLGTHRWPLN
ncbi:uncharacterized protein LOC117579862 [Drosophila guanche]|uniref:uncharacterized protein LOC117579862 n=1 Tax=Drosophila guanche TaxID=7266 RepID=UPI001472664E|nr:uncharacterized protein LOC117579862 [Drosophila guanche]